MKGVRIQEKCLFVLIVIVMAVWGCTKGEPEPPKYDPDKEPVRIGVILPSLGETSGPYQKQLDGIRVANMIMPALEDRKISITVRESGSSGKGLSDAFEELTGAGRVNGIILAVEQKDIVCKLKDPVIPVIQTTVPLDTIRKNNNHVLRICSSLNDQADIVAHFILDRLKVRKTVVIFDQEDDASVLLSSLFSLKMVDAGGVIADILSVKKADDVRGIVERLIKDDAQAVYMPYSQRSQSIIRCLKDRRKDMALITSNIFLEKRFIKGGEGDLGGLYVISEFHPDAVHGEFGSRYVGIYRDRKKELGDMASVSAIGADAYFCLVDIIGSVEAGKSIEEAMRVLRWEGTLSGITGLKPSGHVSKYMHIGRVAGSTLIYVESMLPDGLNPGADVRAQ